MTDTYTNSKGIVKPLVEIVTLHTPNGPSYRVMVRGVEQSRWSRLILAEVTMQRVLHNLAKTGEHTL